MLIDDTKKNYASIISQEIYFNNPSTKSVAIQYLTISRDNLDSEAQVSNDTSTYSLQQ